MALFISQVSFQDQGRRYGVHHLFPLFGVLAAAHQDLVGVDGGAALVPEDDRQGSGVLQQDLHGLGFFRTGPPGAVHIDGVAQHQLLYTVLFRQCGDLLRYHFRAVGVDGGGEAGQKTGGVGDGDAGVGVAVVDGHDTHKASSLPLFLCV